VTPVRRVARLAEGGRSLPPRRDRQAAARGAVVAVARRRSRSRADDPGRSRADAVHGAHRMAERAERRLPRLLRARLPAHAASSTDRQATAGDPGVLGARGRRPLAGSDPVATGPQPRTPEPVAHHGDPSRTSRSWYVHGRGVALPRPVGVTAAAHPLVVADV